MKQTATTCCSSQVRVGVRIRPLTPKETSECGKIVVESNGFDRTVELSKRKFTYDSVFHPTVTQVRKEQVCIFYHCCSFVLLWFAFTWAH